MVWLVRKLCVPPTLARVLKLIKSSLSGSMDLHSKLMDVAEKQKGMHQAAHSAHPCSFVIMAGRKVPASMKPPVCSGVNG